MIILALDTAGVDCSAAVYDSVSDTMLGTVSETIGRGHAERLIELVDLALGEASKSLADIERIAVSVGPGSFTGIRVGVAAARGFALSLGIDGVGISTLDVLASAHLETATGRPVLAAIDAKRGEVYTRLFAADGTPMGEPEALAIEDAKMLAQKFAADISGSATPILKDGAEAGTPDHFPIAWVARLGGRAGGMVEKPKPLYLRGPDAKPQTGFALQHQ
jgi:N6-L-threonylcarbamoyladenine synthase